MNTTFEQISFITEEQKQDSRQSALRLRERLMSEHGFEAFDDTEILATVLSYASGTKDAAGLVAKLLDTFGSLKAVLEARPEQLLRVEGMNKTRASLITLTSSPSGSPWPGYGCARRTRAGTGSATAGKRKHTANPC